MENMSVLHLQTFDVFPACSLANFKAELLPVDIIMFPNCTN